VALGLPSLVTDASFYVPCPVSGKVVFVYIVLSTDVDTPNVLTAEIDGTAITGVSFSIDTGGAALLEAEPTGANAVKRGQALSITTDADAMAAAGAGTAVFLIEQD